MYRKMLSALFAALLILSSGGEMMAQRPDSGSVNRNNSGNHRGNSASRPGSQSGSSNSGVSVRPASNSRNHRPNNSSAVRPGNSGANNKPAGGTVLKPGNNTKPGNSFNQGNNRPGNNTKPGNNINQGNNRPGHNRPGNGGNNWGESVRPGGGSAVGRPGNSAVRPGAGSQVPPAVRPPYSQVRPGYRPGVVVNNYGWYNPYPGRWERPLPLPPVFPVNVRPAYNVPTISSVLGLTFGSLIDYGLNSLIRAGYNVIGSVSDAIYLSNVMQFGYTWPQVSVYYGPTGLATTRFQYLSSGSSQNRYRSVYNQLSMLYGNPILENVDNGVVTATWWGGDSNGYISLSFGPGIMQNGGYGYFTDLLYGSTLYSNY